MTEEVKTADQFEAELLQRARDNANDPMEMAAKAYTIQLARFKSLQHLLKSGRSKMRFLNLIMEYPLNDAKLKAHTQIERDLAILADEVLSAKFLMIFSNYMQHSEEFAKAMNSPLTEEPNIDTVVVEENKGE